MRRAAGWECPRPAASRRSGPSAAGCGPAGGGAAARVQGPRVQRRLVGAGAVLPGVFVDGDGLLAGTDGRRPRAEQGVPHAVVGRRAGLSVAGRGPAGGGAAGSRAGACGAWSAQAPCFPGCSSIAAVSSPERLAVTRRAGGSAAGGRAPGGGFGAPSSRASGAIVGGAAGRCPRRTTAAAVRATSGLRRSPCRPHAGLRDARPGPARRPAQLAYGPARRPARLAYGTVSVRNRARAEPRPCGTVPVRAPHGHGACATRRPRVVTPRTRGGHRARGVCAGARSVRKRPSSSPPSGAPAASGWRCAEGRQRGRARLRRGLRGDMTHRRFVPY